MTLALLNSRQGIPLPYANRHGLITGATGTGKSVSLMRLVEQFGAQGVPVFVSDVKGDLSALSRSCPATLLDLFGRDGQQISVTFQAMGADLVARSLQLSDVQAAVVEIAFAYASNNGLALDTIADFRAILQAIQAADMSHYGHVTAGSIGVVMRALLRLESQGGNQFFRAPCFDVADLLETDKRHWGFGKGATEFTDTATIGRVSILQAQTLIKSPRLYSAFLLFLLSDLYARLPEVGDLDKPRLVFFFDEAHLLFTDCPSALLRRIEQTVRLIRSKGVGVYFVSQRPEDIPELVRSQLAHRIEHDRSLPVGTARFSTMDSSGRPVAPALVRVDLPNCPLGALSEMEKPALPVVRNFQTTAAGQFDTAGYFFLACALAFIVGACWLTWSIVAAGKIGAAAAIVAGIFFAVRKRV